MRKVLIASASVIAINCSAYASDLSNTKSTPNAPVVSNKMNWTGCYVGLNGGYASQSTDASYNGTDEGSNAGWGGAFGGQIGCDYQSGNVVFGVQGLVDWTNLSGRNDYTDNEGGVLTTDTRGFATLMGRIGYTINPETLVYAKVGAAWSKGKYSDYNGIDYNLGIGKNFDARGYENTPSTGVAEEVLTGWAFGGGIEHKLTDNLSIFAEYNYLDFGNSSVELTDENGFNWTNEYENHISLGLVGINYHF